METISQCLDDFFKRLIHTPRPWITEYQQYHDGSHICVADQNGDWVSDCGPEGNKQAEANATLIAHSPALLRTICHTYLSLLVKFAYGQNDFTNSARISLDPTLAILRSDISLATGLGDQDIHDTFESYARQLAN